MVLTSCTNQNKKPQESFSVNIVKDGVISISDVLKSDKIPNDILYDLKYVELKGYKKKENPISSRTVKIVGDRIYIFDDIVSELYCFDFQGAMDYYIDFNKFKTKKDEKIKATSFFIKNGKVNIVDSEKRLLLTFNKTDLIDSKEFSFWATEVEAVDINSLIIFQGYVNNMFGSPYYFIKTDSNFTVKNKYFAVPDTELKASLKIGTTQNHIFKTDKDINMLLDQENSIYKYPDFVAPAYKIDFVNYNINLLSATSLDLPSPSMYDYARVKTFWESNSNVIVSYSLRKELGYIIHNKTNNKAFNSYLIKSLNDMLLFGVLGVHNNSFFTLIENDQITEVLKLKKEGRGFLKEYLDNREPASSNPVFVFFRLRDF
ncbi:6-bladed beta-propeller [Pedobacter nyackensis]|uniref:6-bladed beta-propeller n=1 Tax=Pedobacter nyackensis TaxID=475255 RepID=UPI00135660C8|nr:6-bladed beta-propeller [Pedobacter nyackensis]